MLLMVLVYLHLWKSTRRINSPAHEAKSRKRCIYPPHLLFFSYFLVLFHILQWLSLCMYTDKSFVKFFSIISLPKGDKNCPLIFLKFALLFCGEIGYASFLNLASAILYQIFIFHQMIAIQKLWKIFFISSKKLFLFLRYLDFCISIFPSFFPCQPLL